MKIDIYFTAHTGVFYALVNPAQEETHVIYFVFLNFRVTLRVLNPSIKYKSRVTYIDPYMNRLSSSIFAGAAILVILMPTQSFEITSQIDNSPRTPASLKIIYSHGVGSKNVLDTFAGTYTKDMVVNAPITIKMTLSSEEISRIESKLKEIGFFDSNYRQLLPGGIAIGETTPYSIYYLRVQYDGTHEKELRWSNKVVYKNDDTSLNELSRLIQSIIEAKPEYQSLPEPRAGYA
jgi:hypothetical protein